MQRGLDSCDVMELDNIHLNIKNSQVHQVFIPRVVTSF